MSWCSLLKTQVLLSNKCR
jgi:hypothetical protein